MARAAPPVARRGRRRALGRELRLPRTRPGVRRVGAPLPRAAGPHRGGAARGGRRRRSGRRPPGGDGRRRRPPRHAGHRAVPRRVGLDDRVRRRGAQGLPGARGQLRGRADRAVHLQLVVAHGLPADGRLHARPGGAPGRDRRARPGPGDVRLHGRHRRRRDPQYAQFTAGTTANLSGASLIGDGLASCALQFDAEDTERSRSIILATDNYVSGEPIYTLRRRRTSSRRATSRCTASSAAPSATRARPRRPSTARPSSPVAACTSSRTTRPRCRAWSTTSSRSRPSSSTRPRGGRHGPPRGLVPRRGPRRRAAARRRVAGEGVTHR